MIDIKLKPSNEGIGLELSKGIELTGYLEGVAQRLTIKLRTIHGEWFYNSSIGVPYRRTVLTHNPNLQEIENIFRAEIMSTPEVIEITNFNIVFRVSTRTMNVDFSARVRIPSGEDILNLNLNI